MLNTKRKLRKILSGLLVIILILSIQPVEKSQVLAAGPTTFYIDKGNIEIGADTVSGVDAGGNSITTTNPNGYTIKQTDSGVATANTITVSSGTHNITLENVNIKASDCAFSIAAGAKVNLTLEGSNTLESGGVNAGLHVPASAISSVPDAALTITEDSNGSLTVTGGSDGGAGIGGNGVQGNTGADDTGESVTGEAGGNITINGGTITATGGNYWGGAGIGGGSGEGGDAYNRNGGDGTGGAGGNITINGGTITTNGGEWGGAGIGGGLGKGGDTYNGDGGYGTGGVGGVITISGGTITATGGRFGGAGIGGGYGVGGFSCNGDGGYGTGGAGGTTRIDGGTITVTGGFYGGAGIGGGLGTGGDVDTSSSTGVNGAGTGGAGGSVTINNGTVTATSGLFGGAGIGGGRSSNIDTSIGGAGGFVTINGGRVYAASGDIFSFAAIGGGNGFNTNGAGGENIFKGGSLLTAGPITVIDKSPTDGNNVPVYQATITGLPASTEISYTVDNGTAIPSSTDESGKLYLWLPEKSGSDTTSLIIGTASGYYKADVVVTSTGSSIAAQKKAYLKNLTISEGTFSKSLSPTETNHSVTVDNGVDFITITPTAFDSGNSITVNNSVVSSGNSSVNIPLDVGDNVITITSTVEADVVTYTLTVTRATAPKVEWDNSSPDNKVTVTYLNREADTSTRTDTVAVKTTSASNRTTEFIAGDFQVKDGNSNTASKLAGVNVTAIGKSTAGNTTLTIQVQKNVTATTGHLWYKNACVGSLIIDKIVRNPYLLIIAPISDIAGVANGSPKTAAGLGLPSTVNIATEDSTITTANVTWNLDAITDAIYHPSVLKEQTFTVNGTLILPTGVENGNNVSLAVSAKVTVVAAGTVAAPRAGLPGGTYTGKQNVTLSSTTPGSKIYYTTDGSIPGATSTLYTEPITVAKKMTIKAIAIAPGMNDSPVATFSYIIKSPVINHIIKASAGKNGSISPSGKITVTEGSKQVFTMKADKGYHIADVKVDGESLGALKSYTFSKVTKNHSIYVSFAKNAATQTATDGDTASTQKPEKQPPKSDKNTSNEEDSDQANNTDTSDTSDHDDANDGDDTKNPEKPSEVATGEEPFLAGEDGAKGWTDIIKEIIETSASSTDKATIQVNMNGSKKVIKDVLHAIQGKNIDLILDMGHGITWTINGKNLTDVELTDIDLGILENTKNIPVDIINSITGGKSTRQISIDYSGKFGFTITMIINLDAENAGYYANLYYYNPETSGLDFVTSAMIDENGNTALGFTHASDYAIVISEKDLNPANITDEDDSVIEVDPTNSPTEDKATSEAKQAEENDPIYLYVIGIIVCIAIIGGVAFVIKKRKNK